VRVLVVDSYDSFADNLVGYVGEVVTGGEWLAGATSEVGVRRNDAVSLAADRDVLPDGLAETAHTDDEESVVMGVRHESEPHVGVQFHPESIPTDVGKQLLANILRCYATPDGEAKA